MKNKFDNIAILIGVVILFIIAAYFTSYGYIVVETKKLEFIAEDIDIALEKGIDPMVIRCAYSRRNDQLCVLHTTLRKAVNVQEGVNLKK